MASKEIETTSKILSPIEQKIFALEVTDENTKTEASRLLSQVNMYLDSVIEYKEKKTKPLNQALKVIRAETKPIETRLEALVSSLRKMLGDYQTKQLAATRAEEEKIAARVKEGKGNLKAETAMNKIDELDRPSSVVSTDDGAVKFRTVKKFEVMDMTMLPIAYHLPNEMEIKAAMSAGTELPGVRYFEEQVPVNFR